MKRGRHTEAHGGQATALAAWKSGLEKPGEAMPEVTMGLPAFHSWQQGWDVCVCGEGWGTGLE